MRLFFHLTKLDSVSTNAGMMIQNSDSGGESTRFSMPSTCTPLPKKSQAFSVAHSPSLSEFRCSHSPTS